MDRRKNRKVGVRVLTDDGCLGDAAVGQLHPDRVGAGNHVLIGDDGALPIHDHPGSQAALDVLAVARPQVAEQLVERRRLAALGDHAGGIDVHHGRRRARDRVGEALHDHDGAQTSRRRQRGRIAAGDADGAQQRGLPPDHHESAGQADRLPLAARNSRGRARFAIRLPTPDAGLTGNCV